ncbi:MAG: hypothetical protein Q4F05_08405 [bacterium]|nr:hypothetical protein [bacterium]
MEHKIKVTLTVNECSEFHNLGESHENIRTVEEAIHIWNRIPEERMHGIKAIGIRIEDRNHSEDYSETDIVIGKYMDLDILHYYQDIIENKMAMEFVKELHRKIPDLEVVGKMPGNMQESQEQVNVLRRHR